MKSIPIKDTCDDCGRFPSEFCQSCDIESRHRYATGTRIRKKMSVDDAIGSLGKMTEYLSEHNEHLRQFIYPTEVKPKEYQSGNYQRSPEAEKALVELYRVKGTLSPEEFQNEVDYIYKEDYDKFMQKRKEVMGSALIRPGDIEAVDARDLLEQMVTQNVEAVKKKVDKRIVDGWIKDETKKRRATYLTDARKAYQKIWNTCGNSSVGHNFERIEAAGRNINQCRDCKFAAPYVGVGTQMHNAETRVASGSNEEQVKQLAEQMIQLDLDAGIFSWPTYEDYPNIVSSSKSTAKKGLFKRG